MFVAREYADLDRDVLSTIAEGSEVGNEKGYRTLRVKHLDQLAALTLLARVLGMLVNKTELSGPGGRPLEIEHTIDHSAPLGPAWTKLPGGRRHRLSSR